MVAVRIERKFSYCGCLWGLVLYPRSNIWRRSVCHDYTDFFWGAAIVALNLYFKNAFAIIQEVGSYRYFPVAPQFFLVSAISILAFRRRKERQVVLVTALAWLTALVWTRPEGAWTLMSQWPTWVGVGLQLAFLGACWIIRERFRTTIRDHIQSFAGTHDYDPQRIQASKLQTMGELLASLVHEISNPLTNIKGYNHQISEELNEEEPELAILKMSAERIHFNVDRIMSIARALRNFSRNSARDALQPIPLDHIFQDTLVLMAHPLKLAGVDLKVSMPPQDLRVVANSVELSQVLVNLLGNARDATAGGARRVVNFGHTSTAGAVSIWVEDSGSGIPDEIASEIFKPFYTTKDHGKGTGLGLYISNLIAARHDTELKFETLRDDAGKVQGTRFYIVLKRAADGTNREDGSAAA